VADTFTRGFLKDGVATEEGESNVSSGEVRQLVLHDSRGRSIGVVLENHAPEFAKVLDGVFKSIRLR
jgi:hypothetical protein